MITSQIIDEIKNRLVNTYNPSAIYLFGSYARGEQTENSDLDFAIIVENYASDRHSMLVDGYRALFGLKVAKDLFLYSCEEFDYYSKQKTSLGFKIKHEGKKIYAKS